VDASQGYEPWKVGSTPTSSTGDRSWMTALPPKQGQRGSTPLVAALGRCRGMVCNWSRKPGYRHR